MPPRLSEFKVTRKAMRPAAPDSEQCFYCHQPVGGNHLHSCVLVRQHVEIRATFALTIDEPASWSEEEIELLRNEGSWCKDNLIREIEMASKADGCLCNCCTIRVARKVGQLFLQETDEEKKGGTIH